MTDDEYEGRLGSNDVGAPRIEFLPMSIFILSDESEPARTELACRTCAQSWRPSTSVRSRARGQQAGAHRLQHQPHMLAV